MSDIEDKARRETEEKRHKRLKDHEDILREINDSLRRKKIYVYLGFPRVPKGTEVQNTDFNKSELKASLIWGGKQAFRSRNRETPLKINKNDSTPRRLIVKLANSKDKEKIFKAARDKKLVTFMGRSISTTADLSTETRQARN